MPKARTARVATIKDRLREALLTAGPGGRFLSNRVLAQRWNISYATAHRLLTELQNEGLLERKSQSGTFLPGGGRLSAVSFHFHRRARIAGSYGAHLLELLCAGCQRAGIDTSINWSKDPDRLPGDRLPVIWEHPTALSCLIGQQLRGLLLDEHLAPGLACQWIDSVAIDDFWGGALAADLLRERSAASGPWTVFAGPAEDERNQQRLAGFRSRCRRPRVVTAGSWEVDEARSSVPALLKRPGAGIFCCNDRLAQAVLDHAHASGRPIPPLIGFDDAPVATDYALSTIGLPWDGYADTALDLIRARLADTGHTAARVALCPRPVIRST